MTPENIRNMSSIIVDAVLRVILDSDLKKSIQKLLIMHKREHTIMKLKEQIDK